MDTDSIDNTGFTWVKLVSPTAAQKTKVILASIFAPVLIGVPFLINFLNPDLLSNLGLCSFVIWGAGPVLLVYALFTWIEFLKARRLDRSGVRVVAPIVWNFQGKITVGKQKQDVWWLQYELPGGAVYRASVSPERYNRAVPHQELVIYYLPDRPAVQRAEEI
jgi:hypothetical protein